MNDFAAFTPHARVLFVGLTGGIATGKSTVAGMLREQGVPVVDADALVHEMLAPGGIAVEAVARRFGADVRAKDGGIDRAALAAIFFADEAARHDLERIVHPLVHDDSERRLLDAAKDPAVDIVVYDAALLVESGRHDGFPRLIVVFADPMTQIERLMRRDGLDVDAAGARIRAQMPLAEKVAVADYVIDNSGAWHETRRQVTELYAMLREDAAAWRADANLPVRRG